MQLGGKTVTSFQTLTLPNLFHVGDSLLPLPILFIENDKGRLKLGIQNEQRGFAPQPSAIEMAEEGITDLNGTSLLVVLLLQRQ